jgi:hypothetical protein
VVDELTRCNLSDLSCVRSRMFSFTLEHCLRSACRLKQLSMLLTLNTRTIRQSMKSVCDKHNYWHCPATHERLQKTTVERVADKTSMALSLNDAVLKRNRKLAASLLLQGADPAWRPREGAPAILLAAQ